jgi:FKBP-type peptidyl-prolyl cis-trans isomerase SlyD
MQITAQSAASFHYTLKNSAGEVLDSSVGSDPLMYLHGAGNIVPGLERQMLGKSVGDKFKATVQPEDGYGVPNPAMLRVVPKSAFPADVELEVGMQFGTQTPQGPMAIVVKHIDTESVTVDGNHPLAGVTLHFDVEVVEIREATAEELAHGHVHGPGGHAH